MFLRTVLTLFKSNKNADKVMDKETKDKCMRQLNAENVMDKETKDKYIRQLNYQNRMKIKELEQKEEQAFRMIPVRPIPYGIKQEYIDNDDGEYLQPHNYITIISATEAVSNEAEKSPGNETLNSKGKELITNKKEATVLANDINVNIRSLNDIYDGDRGQNNEQNLCKNDSPKSERLNHGSENNNVQGRNTFERWRLEVNAIPSIYAVPSLDETYLCKDFTPKYELFNHGSKLNENYQEQNPFQMWRLDAAPHIYDRMAEPAIHVSIDQQAELPEISKVAPININKNGQEQNELSTISNSISTVPLETGVNMSELPRLPLNREVVRCKLGMKHILIGACIAVMMVIAGICFMAYYSTLSNTDNSGRNATDTNSVAVDINDVAVTTYNVTMTTNDVPVTTCDVPVRANDVPVTTRDVPVRANDVPVTTRDVPVRANNVPVTTRDVPVTTNDVAKTTTYVARTTNHIECLNLETKCFRFKRKIKDNEIARHILVRDAQYGKLMLVCESLKCGVSALPSGGMNPLYEASEHGHVEVVKLLLTFNVPVDQSLPGDLTPLYISSQKGYTEVVKLLLTYNASVDMSVKGLTPLHVAVWRNREAIVELLCNAGANVNAQTVRSVGWFKFAPGSTPLHVAVINRFMRIVRILISHKAELLKDSNGLTALDISRQKHLSDITEELEGI